MHTVYRTDFHGGASPQWRPRTVEAAPNGDRFLGRFVNQTAVLQLTDLPPHERATVALDLLVIMSWDGSNPVDGPDVMTAAVDGVGRAAATFSNDAAPHDPGYSQTFPALYPGTAENPGLTGASAVGLLGYPDVSGYGGFGDATYRVSHSFAHRGETLTLRVGSRNVVDVGVDPIMTDESFGLDDVVVTLHGVPCPG